MDLQVNPNKERVHALTALAAANDFIHVFDEPTLFNGALWLPHRSDTAEIKAACAAAAALKEAGHPLYVTFCHLSVVSLRPLSLSKPWLGTRMMLHSIYFNRAEDDASSLQFQRQTTLNESDVREKQATQTWTPCHAGRGLVQ